MARKTKRRLQDRRPNQLTRVAFVRDMDAMMYAAVIGEVHYRAAYNTLQLVWTNESDAEFVSKCHETADAFTKVADRYSAQAVRDLKDLFGLGEEHLPYLRPYIAAAAHAWGDLGHAILEATKEQAKQEGLSDTDAERRAVYTQPRWN